MSASVRHRTLAAIPLCAALIPAAAPADAPLLALPPRGEHRAYRWQWQAHPGGSMQLEAESHFAVERRDDATVAITDPEHAAKPVVYAVVNGALGSPAGNVTTGAAGRGEVYSVARPARIGPPVGVPPSEYRIVVMLTAALRDAPEESTREVAGCGDTEKWNARVHRESDGTRTLTATCRGSSIVPAFGPNPEPVRSDVEQEVHVRFAPSGEIRQADGTSHGETPIGERIAQVDVEWSLTSDR